MKKKHVNITTNRFILIVGGWAGCPLVITWTRQDRVAGYRANNIRCGTMTRRVFGQHGSVSEGFY